MALARKFFVFLVFIATSCSGGLVSALASESDGALHQSQKAMAAPVAIKGKEESEVPKRHPSGGSGVIDVALLNSGENDNAQSKYLSPVLLYTTGLGLDSEAHSDIDIRRFTLDVSVSGSDLTKQEIDSPWWSFTPVGFGSLGAFVIACVSLFRTESHNKQLKKRSIEDGFWVREVLIPHFMDTLLDFVKGAPKKFVECKNDTAEFVRSYALEQLNALRDSLIIAAAVDPNLKPKLEQSIDDFDDFLGEDEDIDLYALEEALAAMTSSATKAIRDVQYRKS
ncbi:hypothetical protein [Salinivibrio kushneri]|uniref:hypothetical protein n=1 Tax=Salinivibrio kushneri TaxID=1908198 RepID=UPI0022B51BE9|nr:hypothetical protein [Salinivibrio kushneri]WBA13447.1 hypothetical protein O4546_14035 [Salinivibrio kushneri]